ncbi:MAG TPA: hypothetical protein VGQ59_20660, partial [Cyclobacteriaceae bacterium]|nr:hypothetical protein [Cyclobacteriaceae bacterium]
MFQQLNDKINTSYETEIRNKSTIVLKMIEDKVKSYKWYSPFFESSIDFSEFKISENTIEILRCPKVFWPFRSYGRIRLTLIDNDGLRLTEVKCAIFPGDNSIPYILLIGLVISLLGFIPFFLLIRNLGWITKTIVSLLV